MATTPVMGLPYPIGTDRVMDGDNAIQALAERIESRYARGIMSHVLRGSGQGIDTVHRGMLSTTVTIPANRKIRVSTSLLVNAASTPSNIFIATAIDGVEQVNTLRYCPDPNYYPLGPLIQILDGTMTAGSHQFATYVWTAAGTANINAGAPNYLSVEDCGFASGT